MEDRFENRYAEFWLNDGILQFIYKSGISIDFEAAQTIVADRIKFQKEREYPIFCDTRGIHHIEKEARDFLAIEGSLLAIAVAFLVNSNLSNVIAEFYLIANKPTIPTKVFSEKYEALKFLAPYRY